MKGILEFDLNDPSDILAHKRAVNATDAYIVLFDVNESLKHKRKTSDDDTQYELYDKLLEEFNDKLFECGINLNDLE